MENKKMLDVSKMSNYSVTDGKENESLVFFYKCCNETWIENEPFDSYPETKNEQFFETYQEAKDYYDTLEVDDVWVKRIDEFFVENLDLEFVEGFCQDIYDMILVEEKEYEYTEDDFVQPYVDLSRLKKIE